MNPDHWHPRRRWRTHPHPSDLTRKRRFLFWRFARPFGCMTILFFGLLALLAFSVRRFEIATPLGQLLLLGGCSLALVFPILMGGVWMRVFREVGRPLSQVMAAADEVAAGNLDVRLSEEAPGELGRLSRSFNRMTEGLAQAEQQRRNLTADVAHELRNPLHIIQGNLEGLIDGVYEPTPENLEALLEETHTLRRLVDDLQTLSLAEAGQLHFQMDWIDIGELLADVATSFSGLVESAGLEMKTTLRGFPEQPVLWGDQGRLDQALSNLIANAIRHTPAGGQITLAAEFTIQEDVGQIIIEVSDSGTGILPEDLPYVFDRFWRGDRARTRTSGAGSGLGLAITRQFVQAHGGDIAVTSTPGEWTIFTIRLPVGDAGLAAPTNSHSETN